MSGFNQNLPKEEKIKCILCLSTNEVKESIDGVTRCPDCGATNQAFTQQNMETPSERDLHSSI